MTTGSNVGAVKILCVESDLAALESRFAVLKASGFDAASATPRVAEVVLRGHRFDLIVVSRLSDSDLHRVNNLSDGADVLVLDALTMPSELLSLVAQRLNRHQRRVYPAEQLCEVVPNRQSVRVDDPPDYSDRH
jgi:hypothetical protein